MKQRNGFISNSSSCSFICALSGEIIDGYDWNYPIDNNMYECSECGSHFLISQVQKYDIRLYPNRKGYIKSKDCPFCQGYKVERILLKPGETFKIIKNEDTLEGGFC